MQTAREYPEIQEYCPHCGGTGQEPDGWTLAEVQAKPEEFNKHRINKHYGEGSGVIDLMPQVVSPLHFKDGVEKCHVCHGTGKTAEWINKEAAERRQREDDFFHELLGGDREPIKIPVGKQGITIRAYFNDSDPMTDYYAPHVPLGREYLLAITDRKRQTENTIRKVLAQIPELNKLEWTWHRENYSMGHGYWLESEAVGKFKKKAYDGRSEVVFWYEISYTGVATEHRQGEYWPSKWYKANKNKQDRKPDNKKNNRKVVDTMTKVAYSEYKGHPIITLPMGTTKGFSFGLSKAKAILEHYEEIKKFVEAHE